jgi:plasmid stability protein
MQYTIRNIPRDVDRALRRRAREEGKSLNEVAVDALRRALGLTEEPATQRDLTDIRGTWVDDPEVDAALAEQRIIDPELWG